MEFGKKKVGKVGTSKFLNIPLPGFTIVHKYVGAVFQDHCLICNFIPKTLHNVQTFHGCWYPHTQG